MLFCMRVFLEVVLADSNVHDVNWAVDNILVRQIIFTTIVTENLEFSHSRKTIVGENILLTDWVSARGLVGHM